MGARAEIHGLLRRLAGEGCALSLVSSDADELVALCDRVLVMRHGRIADSVPGDEASEARLLRVAAGV